MEVEPIAANARGYSLKKLAVVSYHTEVRVAVYFVPDAPFERYASEAGNGVLWQAEVLHQAAQLLPLLCRLMVAPWQLGRRQRQGQRQMMQLTQEPLASLYTRRPFAIHPSELSLAGLLQAGGLRLTLWREI